MTHSQKYSRHAAPLALVALLALGACGDDIEALTPPSPFHGIHGMAFTDDGRLLAGSVVGRAIYAVDTQSGKSRVFVPPPKGMADDIALGPNGEIAWTAFLEGKVYSRSKSGRIRELAKGLPGINSIAYAPDGRLYATRVFEGDHLYEIDRRGKRKPRLIKRNMGGLNGFEFGRDGQLYGPLWSKKRIVRVNVRNGRMTTIARGFGIPAAVNFDPTNRYHLYVVDTQRGQVVRVDLRRRRNNKKIVARVKPSIDNLVFSPDGRLFISNMADNAIIEIDKNTGETRTLVSGKLATAGDIALARGEDGDEIYIADVFALRKLDAKTGKISEVARMFGKGNLDYPMHVSVNKNYIVVSGWSSGAVQLFSRRTGRSRALLHNFSQPHDAVLWGRTLIVAEYGKNRLVRLSGRGWKTRRPFVRRINGPGSMAIDEKRNRLYVSEMKTGNILEINLRDGQRSIFYKGLDKPEGLALLPDGRLAVAEVGKKRIVAIESGGKPEVLATSLPIGFEGRQKPPGVATYLPTGVAASEDGTVYFSSDVDAAIYKVSN